MRRDDKGRILRIVTWWAPRILCGVLLATLSVPVTGAQGPPAKPDAPCKVKGDYEKLQEAAAQAAKDLAGTAPAPPDAPTDAQLQALREQERSALNDAQNAGAAYEKARKALRAFNDDPQQGRKYAQLQTDLAAMQKEIDTAEAALETKAPGTLKAVKNKESEISYQRGLITLLMPGVAVDFDNLEAAVQAASEPTRTFSTPEITRLQQEITAANRQAELAEEQNIEAQAAGDRESAKQHQERRDRYTATATNLRVELAAERQRARDRVLEHIAAIRSGQSDLRRLDPGAAIRTVQRELEERRETLAGLERQITALSRKQRDLESAVANAEKTLIGTPKPDGSPGGRAGAWSEVREKLEALEKLDAAAKTRAAAEQAKREADQAVVAKQPELVTAQASANTALAEAKNEAKLSEVQQRVKEKRGHILNDIQREWGPKLKAIPPEDTPARERVKGQARREARKRVDAMKEDWAASLDGVKAKLVDLDCFDAVQEFIGEIDGEMKLLRDRASLVSDMGDADPMTDLTLDPPPTDELPPGLGSGNRKPTDDVPPGLGGSGAGGPGGGRGTGGGASAGDKVKAGQGFTGDWGVHRTRSPDGYSYLGRLQLEQSGARVVGQLSDNGLREIYCKVEGNVAGSTLTFSWYSPDGSRRGTGTLELDPSGSILGWQWGESGGRKTQTLWNGHPIK